MVVTYRSDVALRATHSEPMFRDAFTRARTLLFASTLTVAAFLLLALPAGASAEVIRSFEADITPRADGSFTVEETIAYDFEEERRRGIFRTIENEHAQRASAWYRDRTFDVELMSVTRNGQPEPYLVESEERPFRVRIGDPDVTITGQHTYTISYRVEGALAYYDDPVSAELYWDATGNGWEVAIESAHVLILDERGLTLDERACYAGPRGSTNRCDVAERTPTGAVFAALNLAPGEGLTIAQALDPQMVERQIIEETNHWIFILAGGSLWLIGLLVFVYRYKTRFKLRRATVVQYEPYEDFKPMMAGVLMDGRLDPRDITAGIVYLAEQGYIKIKKTEEKVLWLFNTSDYEITLLQDPTGLDSQFLQEVLKLLFGHELGGSFLSLFSTQKRDREVSDLNAGASVKLASLRSNQTAQRANYKTIQALKKAVRDDLVARGFFEKRTWTWKVAGVLIGLVTFVVFAIGFLLGSLSSFVVGLLLFLALSLVALAFTYRRRTAKGYEARWHLQGFKEFLSKTEKERYAFHNAPEKSPELFMAYLPYAIAFGVEEEWARVFDDITISNPGWYEGGSMNAFSAAALTSDLGAFSSSLASSGTSGSSGSGSSGGGSGGGGGGSW